MGDKSREDGFLLQFLPAQASLRGYLLAVLRDPTAVDDVFQEVASVLWQKFDEFDDSRSFIAWAMGIANMAIRRQRQSEARSRLVFSTEAVERLAAAADECAAEEDVRLSHLTRCIGSLPPNHRRVVSLRFKDRLSLAAIAARIGRNVAAVEMMMVRIRRALRQCVEQAMRQEEMESA